MINFYNLTKFIKAYIILIRGHTKIQVHTQLQSEEIKNVGNEKVQRNKLILKRIYFLYIFYLTLQERFWAVILQTTERFTE